MVVTQSNKLSFLSFFTSCFCFCFFPNNLARKKRQTRKVAQAKKVQFGTVEAIHKMLRVHVSFEFIGIYKLAKKSKCFVPMVVVKLDFISLGAENSTSKPIILRYEARRRIINCSVCTLCLLHFFSREVEKDARDWGPVLWKWGKRQWVWDLNRNVRCS